MAMDYSVMHKQSVLFPVEFWEQEARKIDWFEFPHHIHSKDGYGLDRWFDGGKLNTSYLALDRHVANGRGDQAALIWDSPVTESQKYSHIQN